jgi:type IV pilus assembly protein PilF
MRKSDTVLVVMAACFLIAGCVTTTTTRGSSGKSDANTDAGDAADLNYQLGARYYRNGNYDLARDRLLYSIELEPRNAVAHYTLALTYERLENLRLATESYEQAIRIAPRDYNVQNAYAVFLCNQGQFDEARKHFDRAIEVPDNDSSQVTMTNAGVCMMQKPDITQAEAYFRQALNRKTDFGEALIQLSLLKFGSGDYLGARAFLQRYLSANVPSAGVLFLGVRIEKELGDERAETDYSNHILREFPQSPEARRIMEMGKE